MHLSIECFFTKVVLPVWGGLGKLTQYLSNCKCLCDQCTHRFVYPYHQFNQGGQIFQTLSTLWLRPWPKALKTVGKLPSLKQRNSIFKSLRIKTGVKSHSRRHLLVEVKVSDDFKTSSERGHCQGWKLSSEGCWVHCQKVSFNFAFTKKM